MKRGQLLLAVVAALAVGAVAWFAGGRGDKDESVEPSRRPPRRRPAGAVKVSFAYSPEKEKLLLPLIKKFNGEGNEVGGQAGVRRGHQRVLRRRRDADRQGPVQAGRVVARLLAVGPAAELRGRPALHGRGGALDRAHAARDRDVGADGAGARLPEEEARLRRRAAARDLRQGLGRVRAAGVRRLQARPHRPGLLDLRALGRGRRVLRGARQEGGADRAGHRQRGARASACATSSARSSTTATRRCSSPTSSRRRGRATRARWRWRRSRCSTSTARAATATSWSRSIPRRARSTPTRRSSRSTRRGCARQQKEGAQGVPEVPGRRDHARGGGQVGLPPRQPRDRAGGADHGRQRRRPEAARARAPAARAARAGRDQEGLAPRPQARQHPARARHLGLDERRAAPGAGEGRARGLLPQRRAAGLGRADDLLREDPAAGGPGAAQPRAATSCRRACAT